ncbi:high frequency lysogenization protein HflD [Coralloluteibacterium stylophorae]|uniref:High frequency lysogenization protein HflD homolog n=1 Tax=Coralloluteibacterium stylophorae TaxID=1776034 RepID=A0A8J8AYS6_9GAMM|nr:high frequency lysogenization protein HflD [Coralloluteibacterium stylophorae]MBS7455912.1 high frequency lysogenization protein HflD [Coralloluteibacterium stylophorae]
MSGDVRDRVLALGGLLQATSMVRQIAGNGETDNACLTASIESVFRLDAESPEAVYGSANRVGRGLRVLLQQLEGGGADPAPARLAFTILQVERRFSAQPRMMDKVAGDIAAIDRQREHFGPTHPTVLARLGELYSSTISTLRPRVMVQGNPNYLAQPEVVAEIRATLLAGLRSAVLWRQMGGRYWDVVFARRAMAQAARDWIKRLP